ncbi:hypothetical protein AF333_03020 [Aneurinibacillus migulanus]|uniref:Methyltransferase type 11 domain-containing protein n=1 Tax=Aneurinibacillus migulanus TaxID=47500 RepID=A0A0M0H9C0_ANEMI|nr:hypothetical protein AF333_03020 [Aneurinibacillus migulanus]
MSDRTNYIKIYERAIKWIHKNTIDNQGIIVHSQQKVCYPEVTGYFIPSLIRWGEKKLALQYARWLVSIQNEDGSWNDPLGLTAYTFDTGQILKGLVSMVDSYPEFKVAILKGCHWIVNQIDEEGRITTPDTSQWILPNGKMTPEAIHLYALEPVKLVADKWNIENFSEKIGIALKYYLQRDDLVEFDTLSHFHAYIIEALVDLGETSHAIEAMEKINHIYEQKGFIPGYHNADWVCSTAMFQYALIMYKLGWVERADKIFEYTCHLQNDTGGFFGGYGEGATYFPIEEISWANKYFLDAFWYKIHKSFNKDYSIFPEEISYNDGRYRLVEEVLGENKFHKVVDIGCGKGRYIKNLKEKYPEAELYGVDISDKMLGYLPKGVTPLLGTLLNIPLMDKEVDMAFCVEALEHAVDIPKAIQEMGRIVKEDGVLIIIDKNQERLGALEISEWEQWFDEERVTQLLEKEGFIVTVRKNISYDQKSGQDQLFIAWIARKSTRLS